VRNTFRQLYRYIVSSKKEGSVLLGIYKVESTVKKLHAFLNNFLGSCMELGEGYGGHGPLTFSPRKERKGNWYTVKIGFVHWRASPLPPSPPMHHHFQRHLAVTVQCTSCYLSISFRNFIICNSLFMYLYKIK
jgi:hypothetical protein